MTEFTASNGLRIKSNENEHHPVIVASLGLLPTSVVALREFFQHERDEEIGRWRWPENPDYVVYRRGDGAVLVLFERNAEGGILYRRDDPVCDMEAEAARAYFAAHPERKPWRDAKPGETWRLTVRDRDPLDLDLTFNVIGVTDHILARFARPQVSGEQMEYPIDSDAIVAGRRIWPEEDAS